MNINAWDWEDKKEKYQDKISQTAIYSSQKRLISLNGIQALFKVRGISNQSRSTKYESVLCMKNFKLPWSTRL